MALPDFMYENFYFCLRRQQISCQRKTQAQSLWVVDKWNQASRLLDVTGCPGSVITVLMLSPSKVQYCDN